MSDCFRSSCKKERPCYGSEVIKLCRRHYDMLGLHRDMQYPSTSRRVVDRCQGRVGQSETIYLSTPSNPQQRMSCEDMARQPQWTLAPESLEEKIRQEIRRDQHAQQDAKLKQMEAACSPEALEARIKTEIMRNKEDEYEGRIQQLETINYLASRQQPYFCPPEKWLANPQCSKDSDDMCRTVEQRSKEEFFECTLPSIGGSITENQLELCAENQLELCAENQLELCSENQVSVQGLTRSEIALLDGAACSDRKSTETKIKQQNKECSAKETKLNINVNLHSPKTKH